MEDLLTTSEITMVAEVLVYQLALIGPSAKPSAVTFSIWPHSGNQLLSLGEGAVKARSPLRVRISVGSECKISNWGNTYGGQEVDLVTHV